MSGNLAEDLANVFAMDPERPELRYAGEYILIINTYHESDETTFVIE